MNFETSSHKARWLHSKEELELLRQQLREQAVHSLRRRKGTTAIAPTGDSNDTSPRGAAVSGQEVTIGGSSTKKMRGGDGPITMSDEAHLLRFYTDQIRDMCVGHLSLPKKVQAAAQLFFKRYYLRHSLLDAPLEPKRVMLTCIYLAAKVEESYISADSLAAKANVEPAVLLRSEVGLLQGLSFDLITHSPFRALAGLVQDLQILRQQHQGIKPDPGAAPTSATDLSSNPPPAGPPADPALLMAADEVAAMAAAKAGSAVDALMLSDAPLIHPPGQLALAALRSGWKGRGVRLQAYITRAAALALQKASPGSIPTAEAVAEAAAALSRALDDIDVLGMAGAAKVEREEVADIDKRIKAWKKANVEPLGQQAAVAEEALKAERREGKLRERNRSKEAAEAQLLGMAQGMPVVKREVV